MPAPYTGGCQYGSVRYVLAEPIRLAACHCKECQGKSGSAFGMSMPVNKDSLTVTGRTKQFTRIADSGNELRVCCVLIAESASSHGKRMASSGVDRR